MIKITFMGAGSTVFLRNVLGDCIYTDALKGMEIALYDIDGQRLEQSAAILEAINKGQRLPLLRSALIWAQRTAGKRFPERISSSTQSRWAATIPAPSQISRSPKKYGLRQTIGDTLGIGGIMRALRTIPVLEDFARDMEAVCPNAWFLNYTNPMSMLTGYMLLYRCENAGPVSQRTDVQQNSDGRHRHERPSGGTPGADRRHQSHGLAAGHPRPGRQRSVP